MSADVKQSDREKVLVALEGATRLTRRDIYGLFGRHRTQIEIDALANTLESEGRILRMRIEPTGGNDRHPTEVWEIITSQSPSLTNGSAPVPVDEAPPGEGWLPKAKTLRQAQRGVVPAVAARAGRIDREKDRASKGTLKIRKPRVSDEQRGATHLIGKAFSGYREQGIIEERGDWIRLVKNPAHRPPHHWYEALLHFLAEGHPTLDGKWHRRPKALGPFVESLLGRRLRPDESVTRRPGRAGSWNPADIIIAGDDGVQYLSEILDDRR